MANDLNLKKSWNPKSFKNREAVWKKEKEIYDLYKKNQADRVNSQKLKQENELVALATKSTNSNVGERKTRWMYKEDDKTLHESVKNEDKDLAKKEEKSKFTGVDQVINIKMNREETKRPKPDQVLSKDDPMYAIQLERSRQKELANSYKKTKSLEKSHSRIKKRSRRDLEIDDRIKRKKTRNDS